MKTLTILSTALAVFLLSLGVVVAIDTTTSLSTTGDATAIYSSEESNSGSQSAKLQADLITGDTNEGRVRIDLDNPIALSDLDSIYWQQYLVEGYISHVDIFLDSGVVLTAEGAHQNNNEVIGWSTDTWFPTFDDVTCDLSSHWATWISCPSDLSTVNDETNVWRSGAGGTAGNMFNDVIGSGDTNGTLGPNLESLGTYKAGYNEVSGTDMVEAIEIEVDGWIAESTSFIDDIMVNGELVEDFDTNQDIEGEIGTSIIVQVSPSTLNFGLIQPGTTNNPATNGPIMIDPTGSNVNLNVEVDSVTGFPFEDGLMFDGSNPVGQDWDFACNEVDNICTYDVAEIDPTLDVPAGAVVGSKTGTIVYTVTGPTP